jgi:hypothetical protein
MIQVTCVIHSPRQVKASQLVDFANQSDPYSPVLAVRYTVL